MTKKIIILGVLLIMAFSLAACGNQETPAERIERICEIELPEEMEIEYNYFQSFPQGDFTQYTIFKLKKEPTEFLSDNSFSEVKTGVYHGWLYDTGLSQFPKEYHPNWESEYMVGGFTVTTVRSCGASALYFPNELKLIFRIEKT